MSLSGAPSRDDVIAMLSTYGNRKPEEVDEHIGSIERAWLVHQVEQRYGIELEFDSAELARMSTVAVAVPILREAIAGGSHEH